jgi:hypothetical protein
MRRIRRRSAGERPRCARWARGPDARSAIGSRRWDGSGWKLSRELDESSRTAAAELRQGLEHLIATGKQEGSVRAGVVELWTSVWLVLVTFAAEKVASREWAQTHPHALATLDAAWEAIARRPEPAEALAGAE